MHPEIFSIGPLHIRSYGLMLAIGFLAGIFLIARRAAKAGENPDRIYDLAVWIVVSSLFGSRLYYVLTHYGEFRAPEGVSFAVRVFIELRNMFWPVGADGQVGLSGLIYYGGLIAATAAVILYLALHRLNVPKYLDIFAPIIPVGEVFTRIGCFLNGCCFGHPTDSPFGVTFPEWSAAGAMYPGMAVHPTQLYSSFAALLIMGILLFAERYKRFEGFNAALFFFLYGIDRFVLDYFRYYESGMKIAGLSQNQILSVAIILVSGTVLAVFTVRAGRRVGA